MLQNGDLSSHSPDQIRAQIAKTRTSLSNHLEELETEVRETVEEAASSVMDTVREVKRTLNIKNHIQEHPLSFFFGAVACGVIIGKQVRPENSEQTLQSRTENTGSRPFQDAKSGKSFLNEHFADEIKRVKNTGVELLLNTLQEVAKDSLPPSLSSVTGRMFTNVKNKLIS
jgi:hypothetical protein